MQPKEKAIELREKFSVYDEGAIHGKWLVIDGLDSAIICVEEILLSYSKYAKMYDQDYFDGEVSYWRQVLTELKKLK